VASSLKLSRDMIHEKMAKIFNMIIGK